MRKVESREERALVSRNPGTTHRSILLQGKAQCLQPGIREIREQEGIGFGGGAPGSRENDRDK